MPLDELEKKELAKRIEEQRRSVWRGEVAREGVKKKRNTRKARRVPDRQQERGKVEQTSEPYQEVVYDDLEHKETEQVLEKQQEYEKEELAKRIKEQRKSVWKGETGRKRWTKKRQNIKAPRRISKSYRITEEQEEIERPPEDQQEPKRTELTLEDQSAKPKAKRKSKGIRLNTPGLKLALLVIISLIAAIIIGISIGYLAAVRDLIPI